jgi:hypothetical protein
MRKHTHVHTYVIDTHDLVGGREGEREGGREGEREERLIERRAKRKLAT